MSGCVGRVPVHCFARGPVMLLRRPGHVAHLGIHYPDYEQTSLSSYSLLLRAKTNFIVHFNPTIQLTPASKESNLL